MKGKPLEGYLSVRQTMERLKLTSRQGVLYLIDTGELAPVRYVDKYYLIPEDTVEKLLKNRKGIEDERYKAK